MCGYVYMYVYVYTYTHAHTRTVSSTKPVPDDEVEKNIFPTSFIFGFSLPLP